jgi:hypothetical protein
LPRSLLPPSPAPLLRSAPPRRPRPEGLPEVR